MPILSNHDSLKMTSRRYGRKTPRPENAKVTEMLTRRFASWMNERRIQGTMSLDVNYAFMKEGEHYVGRPDWPDGMSGRALKYVFLHETDLLHLDPPLTQVARAFRANGLEGKTMNVKIGGLYSATRTFYHIPRPY